MVVLAKTGASGHVLTLLSALLLTAACGDGTYSLSTSSWPEPGEVHPLPDLEGSVVELVRRSSRCNQDLLDGLVALVGSQVEFPGETVSELKSPCAGGHEVRVDIDLEGRSILFDFSNVVAARRFVSADFEGFVVTDMYESVAAFRGVSIDRTLSTMDVRDEAISVRAHSVSVNLAGVAFDPTSFLKIDLLLEDVPE